VRAALIAAVALGLVASVGFALVRLVGAPAARVLRVGVVQIEGIGDSVEASRLRVEGLIREAAGRGAEFVLLPELYATFPAARAHASMDAIRAEAQPVPGPLTNSMIALARELDVQIAFGMAERDGEALYNSVVLVGPEGVAGRYHKRVLVSHAAMKRYFEAQQGAPLALRDDGALDEATMFSRGAGPLVTAWGGVPTGVLICADGGLKGFWAAMKQRGAELVLWPTSSLGTYTAKQLSPSGQAAALGVPVLHANRSVREPPIGYSVIVDRDGTIVASAGNRFGDVVLVADVHLPPAGT